MADSTTNYAAPLRWPADVKRASTLERIDGPFQVTGSKAMYDLDIALRLMRASNIVVTANATVLRSGTFESGSLATHARDPGVAIYLRRKGADLVFALDRFTTPLANLRALGLTLDAMRTIDRYGGSGFEDRALAGFAALPAQAGTAHWSVALGLVEMYEGWSKRGSPKGVEGANVFLEIAEHSYRELAKKLHPDHGGSDVAMIELNRAIEEARKELR